ncbi:MAG: hypothetical protein AAFR45_01315 [Pseudomonadota bacterium]
MVANIDALGPIGTAAVVIALGACLGLWPVRKLVLMHEARNELRIGSAGYLRRFAGWSIVGLWAAAIWFCGTIIGDWYMTNDLTGAVARAEFRFRVLLQVLAAMADSN